MNWTCLCSIFAATFSAEHKTELPNCLDSKTRYFCSPPALFNEITRTSIVCNTDYDGKLIKLTKRVTELRNLKSIRLKGEGSL